MGKAILILILGSIVLFGIVNMNTNRYLNNDTDNSVGFYAEARAKSIACSMTQMILSQIADSMGYNTSSSKTASLLGGTAEYSVTKVFFAEDSLKRIYVKASFLGREHEVITYCSPGGWKPPFIRGAWTANANLNKTISDMFIDGRDYKLDGTIVPGNGVYGVSSSVPFVNTQSAAIGGTHNGVDYPMTYPENPDIIEQYNWGGIFPQSPDQILGYPEGTLKAIAQSGMEGSQYVTNVNSLKWPLKGVTYVEPSSSTTFTFQLETPPNGQVNKGMLIVHRAGCTSSLNGLKARNKTDPPFVGLIITDYSFHHHLDVLGAMMQLSPNLELSKECNGNKDHWVFYSSEAIIKATEVVAKYSPHLGNNNSTRLTNKTGSALGERRYSAIAYYE